VTLEAALEAARIDLGYAADSSSMEPPQLMILASAGGQRQLVWKITLAHDDPPLRMIYFVDAQSGDVAAKIDALETAKNRRTYTANNGSSLPGTLLISEGGSSTDIAVQAAHDNAGATYDYYFSTFGRDSFNNAGAMINSTVHYGSSYNNAFWNGYQMVYGDGDGYVFGPLSGALDVVAHELTHAVTQYTADLVYSYQSGALNESYSDVFGAMVDRDDWLMGEDVYTPGTSGDALRSLSNPSQYGQPEHMDSFVNTSSDNGGVHTNSGIPNKAAYNIAQAIGKDKMEKVWYRALTLYLTSGAQFSDARDASVQAAADLYGTASAEVTAVSNGFAAVGIGGIQQSDYSARVEIDHTYRGDLVVTLGVGDPDNPTWSTVVSNRAGGSADNVYSTVDISAAATHIPPNWQNRWYLKVYDAAGYDEGFVRKFTITDHETTYTAMDVPIEVMDYTTTMSFIPTFDGTPPSVVEISPQNGATAYYSSAITARFSEDINQASLDASTFMLKKQSDGSIVTADVTYDPVTYTGSLHVAGGLAYSTAYDVVVSQGVIDLYGNALASEYSWSFTTAPAPRNYFFTWYDQMSPGVKDWLVIGQPSTLLGAGAFDVSIAGQQMLPSFVSVDQNHTAALSFPGTMAGPVKIEALDGTAGIVSRRTLYGDSFEEINGFEEGALTSRYYFAWYDTVSPGSQDWILIANPNPDAVQADVYISGQKMNSVPYTIDPGESVTPQYPGIMGGPVEVIAYEPGNELVPKNVMASERVLWNGNFNELVGIPANSLGNDYLFTWYDQASPGAQTWVLVSNPNSSETLAVEITVAGQKVANSATGEQYYVVAPGESITPSFPGVLDGPMEVKGYNASTYDPANPGVSNMNFFTTQRSLFGSSFNEVAGLRTDRLRPQYFFSWYDQVSAGASDWVLVSNPGVAEVTAEIWIAGQKLKVLNIAPGETETPTFGGVMNGPVEIRGYDAATYDPNNPGAPNRNIFTSQRVLWKGHFNEVEGQTLQ
jgi:Zn-dependent metalloprotease